MDTMAAFLMGEANRGKPMMVFDWDRAAALMRERSAKECEAFLQSDRSWTGGVILEDGQIVSKDKTYTYLASTWATPILEIDGEEIECFRMESEVPDWDAHTYWPDSARKIFAGEPA